MPIVKDGNKRADLNIYDTVCAEDLNSGRFHAFGAKNLGRQELCNLVVPGCVQAEGIYQVKSIAVGAPLDVLTAWRDVQMSLCIGHYLAFSEPLRSPSGGTSRLSELKAEGADFAQVSASIDWTFFFWNFDLPFTVAALQAFSVMFEGHGAGLHGELRVVVKGELSRR